MQDLEKKQLCDLGRAVLDIESKMIHSLIDRIDHTFADACELLLSCKSKVIVMGIGKSGHIGKKIAATFASTGTPAFFIHPTEAKHGDFGMITSNDILLLISNSGETEEILAILPFIKRLGLYFIALTGQPCSTLAKAATVNINVNVTQEACPLGLAPTSSTTAALAMGDALAISLLQKRGFTAEDFAKSHPGGHLGKKLLLRISDLMHTGTLVPKINPDAFLKNALIEISEKKLGMTTVINQHNKLIGIVTDGDIRRALDNDVDVHHTPVHAMMTKSPKTAPEDMLVAEALHVMEANKITVLIVINEEQHPIGAIHLHDILRAGVI